MVCFGNYSPDLPVQFPHMSFDNVFVAWLLIYVIFLFPKRLELICQILCVYRKLNSMFT